MVTPWPVLPRGYVPVDPDEQSVRREKGTDKRFTKRRAKTTAEVTGIYTPDGVLFRVEHEVMGGWFDLNGYWCRRDAKGKVKVFRGPPRKVIKMLRPAQQKELDRVRLNARRNGKR